MTNQPAKEYCIKVKVKLSLCLTKYNTRIQCLMKHHAIKICWGNEGIAPPILNLGATWKWVVSFKHRPFYRQRKTTGRRLSSRAFWIMAPCSYVQISIWKQIPYYNGTQRFIIIATPKKAHQWTTLLIGWIVFTPTRPI